jgi:hypothetical protein
VVKNERFIYYQWDILVIEEKMVKQEDIDALLSASFDKAKAQRNAGSGSGENEVVPLASAELKVGESVAEAEPVDADIISDDEPIIDAEPIEDAVPIEDLAPEELGGTQWVPPEPETPVRPVKSRMTESQAAMVAAFQEKADDALGMFEDWDKSKKNIEVQKLKVKSELEEIVNQTSGAVAATKPEEIFDRIKAKKKATDILDQTKIEITNLCNTIEIVSASCDQIGEFLIKQNPSTEPYIGAKNSVAQLLTEMNDSLSVIEETKLADKIYDKLQQSIQQREDTNDALQDIRYTVYILSNTAHNLDVARNDLVEIAKKSAAGVSYEEVTANMESLRLALQLEVNSNQSMLRRAIRFHFDAKYKHLPEEQRQRLADLEIKHMRDAINNKNGSGTQEDTDVGRFAALHFAAKYLTVYADFAAHAGDVNTNLGDFVDTTAALARKKCDEAGIEHKVPEIIKLENGAVARAHAGAIADALRKYIEHVEQGKVKPKPAPAPQPKPGATSMFSIRHQLQQTTMHLQNVLREKKQLDAKLEEIDDVADAAVASLDAALKNDPEYKKQKDKDRYEKLAVGVKRIVENVKAANKNNRALSTKHKAAMTALREVHESVKKYIQRFNKEVSESEPTEVVGPVVKEMLEDLIELKRLESGFVNDTRMLPVVVEDFVMNARESTDSDSLMHYIGQIEESSKGVSSKVEKRAVSEELLDQRQRHLQMEGEKIIRIVMTSAPRDVDVDKMLGDYLFNYEKTRQLSAEVAGISLAPNAKVFESLAYFTIEAMKDETSKKSWLDFFRGKKIPEHTKEYMDIAYRRAQTITSMAKCCPHERGINNRLKGALTKIQQDMAEKYKQLKDAGKKHEAEAERSLSDKFSDDFSLLETKLEEDEPISKPSKPVIKPRPKVKIPTGAIPSNRLSNRRFDNFYEKFEDQFWKYVCGLKYENAASLCRENGAGKEMSYFCKLQSMKYQKLYLETGNNRYFDLSFSLGKVARHLGYIVEQPEKLKEALQKFGKKALI